MPAPHIFFTHGQYVSIESVMAVSLSTAGNSKAICSCPSEESNGGLGNWRTWDTQANKIVNMYLSIMWQVMSL